MRVRYMHMNPHLLDAAGILSGKMVREGEVIGKVGNFNGHEHGTTYHLHFDMQVPTRIGWLFVNPYMTLVPSYEHLIGARGTEIKPGDPAPPIAGVTPVVEHGHYVPPVIAGPPAAAHAARGQCRAGDALRVVTLPKPRPEKIGETALPAPKPRAVADAEPERHHEAKPHHKAKPRHKAAKRRKAARHEASADKKKHRHARHHKKRHSKHRKHRSAQALTAAVTITKKSHCGRLFARARSLQCRSCNSPAKERCRRAHAEPPRPAHGRAQRSPPLSRSARAPSPSSRPLSRAGWRRSARARWRAASRRRPTTA